MNSYITSKTKGHEMEEFMTTKEASEKWNISIRQVQNRCKSGRIKDVLRVGTHDLIPKDAMKPTYTYVYKGMKTER